MNYIDIMNDDPDIECRLLFEFHKRDPTEKIRFENFLDDASSAKISFSRCRYGMFDETKREFIFFTVNGNKSCLEFYFYYKEGVFKSNSKFFEIKNILVPSHDQE